MRLYGELVCVRKQGRKRAAYPTEKAALDSLRARNTRWLKLLRHNINRANATAAVLDSGNVRRDWFDADE